MKPPEPRPLATAPKKAVGSDVAKRPNPFGGDGGGAGGGGGNPLLAALTSGVKLRSVKPPEPRSLAAAPKQKVAMQDADTASVKVKLAAELPPAPEPIALLPRLQQLAIPMLRSLPPVALCDALLQLAMSLPTADRGSLATRMAAGAAPTCYPGVMTALGFKMAPPKVELEAEAAAAPFHAALAELQKTPLPRTRTRSRAASGGRARTRSRGGSTVDISGDFDVDSLRALRTRSRGFSTVVSYAVQLTGQVEMLQTQLKQVAPSQKMAKFMPLSEVRRKLEQAVARVLEGDESAEAELEELDAAMKLHPEFLQEQKEAKKAWQKDHNEIFCEALKEMRRIIPTCVGERGGAGASLAEFRRLGMVEDVARRVFSKKILWLLRMPRAAIARFHQADLQSKYSYQGLDLVEMRAIWAVLHDSNDGGDLAFQNDATGVKAAWLLAVKTKLEEMEKKAEQGPGGLVGDAARNRVYRSCPAGELLRFDDCTVGEDKVENVARFEDDPEVRRKREQSVFASAATQQRFKDAASSVKKQEAGNNARDATAVRSKWRVPMTGKKKAQSARLSSSDKDERANFLDELEDRRNPMFENPGAPHLPSDDNASAGGTRRMSAQQLLALQQMQYGARGKQHPGASKRPSLVALSKGGRRAAGRQ